MKQLFTLLTACITILFSVSCSGPQSLTGNNKIHKADPPKFMDEVTINSGSNSVSLVQHKNIYDDRKSGKESNKLADQEINLNEIRAAKNQDLAAFIKEWYGVPYQYGGTSKNGIDCSAFVRELYEDVYNTHLLRTAFEQFSASTPIFNKQDLEEGDLVFFKIHSRHISHVGVYLSGGKFVHASSSSGVMISDLGNRYWTRYYAGAGRVQG
jgi:lipoprotein Spr